MGGRHRYRARDRRVRRLLMATVPVIAAAGLTAAVVLGGGAFATPRVSSGSPAAAAPISAGATGGTVPTWLRDAAGPGPLAGVAGDAAGAARQLRDERAQAEQERQKQQEAHQDRSAGAGVCDLDGPPRFDDPAHPDEITNRDCGYVDGRGRERSHDPWIDGQLLSSYGE
ncbi:hypothetical protein EV378_7047 [Pseudonocardia endophytica]|uniref:Uncharacterized protein n=2 Tax=Pseudonocardia endophytica TaxID=401976 RepID=A0A4V2PI28_PSEEN|nr:hypothetical protein EV378_7047 [Pseudonocardia endophytica]